MPLALHGEHISPLPRQRLVGLSFSSEAGTIRLWVDAMFEEGFALPQQDLDSALEMPTEGDAWLF